MNKIIYLSILLIGLVITSCSSDDEPVAISLSNDFVEFDYNGGEQQIIITSSDSWTFQCNENWLTIRKTQTGLRIIADENNNFIERNASISIYVGDSPKSTISITQKASMRIIDNNEIAVSYESCRYSLKHYFKNEPEIEASDSWVKTQCIGDSVIILIDKNYDMENRKSSIRIYYNSSSQDISILQAACPWYDSFKMVNIPAGSFFMGSQSEDENSHNYDKDAFSIESPVHKVSLSSYNIGAFEVTQEQWIAAMGNNPSLSQLGGKYPIENVSWDDVQLFISKLRETSGKKFRLPTEAEWEYAAKGAYNADTYIYAGSDIPSSIGWFYSNSNSSIHEVGLKLPNSLGLYDMTGNVGEWVMDWLSNYPTHETTNPTGSSYGELKINRGGSCNASSKNCRNSYRNMNSPTERSGNLGFRLVLED